MIRSLALCLLVLITLHAPADAIEQQRQQNWCWAASVQDVLIQAGIYQTQEQVAARLDGWPTDRPASILEVVALNRSYGLRSWQAGRPGSPAELYNTLASGWKLIAFVRPSSGPVGHYIVLQGFDGFGNIIVSDPWTGQTFASTPNRLYYQWRWGDSVVVGR
tara:strand:- start:13 stop:498 length:486 start_codon:yes stop_codon:yes gene_type:complete